MTSANGWRYRCGHVTPTCWQHREQRAGRRSVAAATPVQIALPNGTSRSLISIQYRSGRISARAASVFSGVVVATYPQRFVIRCTWISTARPPAVRTRRRGSSWRSSVRHPGTTLRSSNESGTTPSWNSDSIRLRAIATRSRALARGERRRSVEELGGLPPAELGRTPSGVRASSAKRRRQTAAVVSSRVLGGRSGCWRAVLERRIESAIAGRSNIAALGSPATALRRRRNASSMSKGSLTVSEISRLVLGTGGGILGLRPSSAECLFDRNDRGRAMKRRDVLRSMALAPLAGKLPLAVPVSEPAEAVALYRQAMEKLPTPSTAEDELLIDVAAMRPRTCRRGPGRAGRAVAGAPGAWGVGPRMGLGRDSGSGTASTTSPTGLMKARKLGRFAWPARGSRSRRVGPPPGSMTRSMR